MLARLFVLLFVFLSSSLFTAAQSPATFRSQEVSEEDGVPVLIKHLPDWEAKRDGAVLTNKTDELRVALGARPVLELIDFAGGTEAVTANYDSGKLLIVEYMTPQASIEADTIFRRQLETQPDSTTAYRRIGNYSAFVFDVTNSEAANALLDQIKYQKVVQWLGEDPYKQQKLERFFAIRTADIFISTVFVIVGGVAFALISGILVGFLYFRMRDQRRQTTAAFSDAGGMTRLNLDDLSGDK